MVLKPIIHGTPDPFEIPYYCKGCELLDNRGGGDYGCTESEGGNIHPRPCFLCFKRKSNVPTPPPEKKKE